MLHPAGSKAPCELPDRFDLVVQHGGRETGIGAEEERAVHDLVGTRVVAERAEGGRPVLAELYEDGLLEQIAAEEHAIADLPAIEMSAEVGMGEWCARPDPEHESEP